MRKTLTLAGVFLGFLFSHSQVVLTTAGTPYTQTFNSLAQSGTNNTWTDNSTLTGWYSTQGTYIGSNGGSATGGLYSFGPASPSADVSDRALGVITSGSVGTVRFGLQLQNSTGNDLTSFSVSYTGEQWRRNTATQTLQFEYSLNATSLTSGTWVALTALDFTGPQTGTAAALDGNATANRASLATNLTSTVPNNGTIWFRWTKTGANSPGLGVDDFAVTASASILNTITTGTVAAPPFCVDATTPAAGTVAYTATGTYNTTFTAYLSDATGSFASPVSIGSAAVNGTNPAGTINITIPAGTTSGTGYRISVDATSPTVIGSASTAFEIVADVSNVSAPAATAGDMQVTVSWSNPTACFDEVMIVAKATSSVTATPTGDGSAYSASLTFGSGTAFDGGFVVYKGTTSPQTVTGLTNGTPYFLKLFTRRGSNWSSGVEVSATPLAPVVADLVINQFSPDYGGANDEYVELLNKTNSPFNLSGLSLRYQPASGSSTTNLGNLTGIIPARSYWLLSPNATVTVGLTSGLSRDGSFTAGMAAAAGQIAIVRISDGAVIDGVGYGTVTGGTFREGTAAPAPPTDGGLKRNPNGADTDNNATDFVTVNNASILVRNSSQNSPLPVKFGNLRAEQRAGSVIVSWSSFGEANVIRYTVERSANGRDFSAVASATPRGGSGGGTDYAVADLQVLTGNVFYRVRSVEGDGRVTLSNVLQVTNSRRTPALTLYPNPVRGNEIVLQLTNLAAGSYTFRILGTDGRLLRTKTLVLPAGSCAETLSVAELPPGLYTVQATGAQGFSQRFLKQ